ncbi:PIN domain-containing protein [bacterium]|nr:PIN domain-containing protein [bacterium]
MDLIYLDYNCFQRGFDDPRQTRIQMEALACQEIFIRAERDEVRLVWSFMHEDETVLCPFPERKYEVLRLATLCKVRVGPEEEIYKLALSYKEKGGLSAKDAIHLACAFYIEASFFLTCDDRLMKQVKRLKLDIVMNPVDYIRQEEI